MIKFVNYIIVPALLCAFNATFTQPASAGTVYDTSLASPDTNPATAGFSTSSSNSSWYSGTGNPQGGFTVTTDPGSNIELGMRAKIRNGAIIDSPDNVYLVSAGNQAAGRAFWNYEYSIDLDPNGIGSLTFNDVNVSLAITDVTKATNKTVNPLNGGTYVADDLGFGTTNGITDLNRHFQIPTDWSAQNSENPGFANFLPGYNSSDPDLYQFDLVVTAKTGGAILATDTMFVQVTPEPSTMVLLSAGALGLFLLRRRLSQA